MEKALQGKKQKNFPRPEGMVDVKIDLVNGRLAGAYTLKSEFEVFRSEYVPTEYSEPPANTNISDELDVMDEIDGLGEEQKTDETVGNEIDFG
jgi:membrane carboxypeptidase/penicillin-binding protein